MNDYVLDDDHNVARYCSPRYLDSNRMPKPVAFALRKNEDFLSVNWLEYFGESNITNALERIAEKIREHLEVKHNGKFAVISIRGIKLAGHKKGFSLSVERRPTSDDESHAGIFGYAIDDMMVAVEIARAIRTQDVYSAEP